MHDGVKTARRSSLRVVNLVGQEWTLGATNWRSSSGEVSNNNCDGRRSTDDLGQLITPSVHLRVQNDARETARRAGPSATADTRFPRRRIDTARTVCAAGSMKLSSVRLSVRPSVFLFVRPIIRSARAVATGLLLRARLPGNIDRLLHGLRSATNASSVTLSAGVGR